MAQTYTQILKQIEGLQSQAERLRRAEVEGVVARIRQAIEVYSLTPADLGFGGSTAGAAKAASGGDGDAAPVKRRRRRGAGKTAKPVRTVKFSNGEGGTWGGLGKRPQWLRDALEQGRTLDDFLVK